MFKRITYNFVKLTFLLFCLVIAFGVSFYLLIHVTPDGEGNSQMKDHPKNDTTIQANEGISTNNTRFAKSLILAILKTAIMSTGEFDFSNLDFHYFPASSLLFALFIFSIFLVAMNLLNGIAISDIQAIREYAIQYKLQDQIDCIINFDNFKSIYSKLYGSNDCNRGLIFQSCFRSKVITSYPNRSYPSCSVKCDGHKECCCTNRIVFYFMKLVNSISCNKYGYNEHICKECKSNFRHHYTIPPKFVALAKKIKEGHDLSEKESRTETRLMILEKCLVEQKNSAKKSTEDHHQKLEEIYDRGKKTGD